MKRARNIFLHFFDIHYLNEKGVTEWKSTIYREACLATRIALLGADNIIIPASSYFESDLCRKIINSYSTIHYLGLFKLVGNASNIAEFIQLKTAQYKFNNSTLELYVKKLNSQLDIPFFKRHRSSTADISKQWQDLQVTKDIAPLFRDIPDVKTPDNIEYLWNETPYNLNGKPFIVENVFPILFPKQKQSLIARNTLHSHINQYYFSSYTMEYKAGVISDLVYLEPNYKIFSYDICLPYKYIINELTVRNKMDRFVSANPEEIISFRESDEWISILNASFQKKQSHDTDILSLKRRKILYIRKESSSGNNITQFNIEGDFHMGDNYQAGQVGAQGPNAHAHDITFNQIWNQNKKDIDLEQLAEQLSNLRLELSKNVSSPEEYSEIGNIANAEMEAKSGNGPKAIEFLSKVGKWSFNTATALGVAVAANAIKLASG